MDCVLTPDHSGASGEQQPAARQIDGSFSRDDSYLRNVTSPPKTPASGLSSVHVNDSVPERVTAHNLQPPPPESHHFPLRTQRQTFLFLSFCSVLQHQDECMNPQCVATWGGNRLQVHPSSPDPIRGEVHENSNEQFFQPRRVSLMRGTHTTDHFQAPRSLMLPISSASPSADRSL